MYIYIYIMCWNFYLRSVKLTGRTGSPGAGPRFQDPEVFLSQRFSSNLQLPAVSCSWVKIYIHQVDPNTVDGSEIRRVFPPGMHKTLQITGIFFDILHISTDDSVWLQKFQKVVCILFSQDRHPMTFPMVAFATGFLGAMLGDLAALGCSTVDGSEIRRSPVDMVKYPII